MKGLKIKERDENKRGKEEENRYKMKKVRKENEEESKEEI
jgi:hypothetical protein